MSLATYLHNFLKKSLSEDGANHADKVTVADTIIADTRKAAELGLAWAQFVLGGMYEYGTGVPEDYQRALKWYRLAVEQELAEAQHRLGYMYDVGNGVPEDDREAVKWYRLAAKQGLAEAQLSLGYMYRYGEGVPQDYQKALKWYLLAAEQGNLGAQFSLGEMYYEGFGNTTSDYEEAVEWYRLAAEQGDLLAQIRLGEMHYRGLLLDPEVYEFYEDGYDDDYAHAYRDHGDYVEAAKWYRLAAEQGSADAQLRLGEIYYEEGLDYEEAAKWYRLAAEQGSADAQLKLGNLYHHKYTPDAAKWYHLAARQGSAEAQNRMGFIYAHGIGVPGDRKKSAKWYRLAAEHGDLEAQFDLGRMYYEGKDYKEAYIWYSLVVKSDSDKIHELSFPEFDLSSEETYYESAIILQDKAKQELSLTEEAEAQKEVISRQAEIDKRKAN